MEMVSNFNLKKKFNFFSKRIEFIFHFILITVHYYNYYSDAWNSNIFPKARFVSEYGFQSIPSIHSIKETLHTNDSIDKVIDHRQHFPLKNLPITTLIQRNLPMPTGSGEKYWKTYVYFSQLSQAMATKIETETYRY